MKKRWDERWDERWGDWKVVVGCRRWRRPLVHGDWRNRWCSVVGLGWERKKNGERWGSRGEGAVPEVWVEWWARGKKWGEEKGRKKMRERKRKKKWREKIRKSEERRGVSWSERYGGKCGYVRISEKREEKGKKKG